MPSIDDKDEHLSYIARLNHFSAFHALHRDAPKRIFSDFDGIMVEKGAARESSGGLRHFFVYYKAMGQKPFIDGTRAAGRHFGIGTNMLCRVGNIVSR